MNLRRIFWFGAILLGLGFFGYKVQATRNAETPTKASVTVYRSDSCSCCGKWVSYLSDAGYKVIEKTDTPVERIKKEHGVPESLMSCHTSILDKYAIEGHVPIEAIEKLLKDKPKAKGIGVPGMPAGSPGMESSDPEPYTVYAFNEKGKLTPFLSVKAKQK